MVVSFALVVLGAATAPTATVPAAAATASTAATAATTAPKSGVPATTSTANGAAKPSAATAKKPITDEFDYGHLYGDIDHGMPFKDMPKYTPPEKTWKDRWLYRDKLYRYDYGGTFMSYLANVILGVFIAYLLVSTIQYRKHDVISYWRRRIMAAKYKRVKKSAAGSDGELSGGEEDVPFLEVVTSTFTADKSCECAINLGEGKAARVCQVYVQDIEKTSELVFLISEGFRRSGDVELSSISLVELFFKDRVKMEYVAFSGDLKEVGKAAVTTPEMLRAAKSFRVTILPPTTR
jgi:hypothetical protein